MKRALLVLLCLAFAASVYFVPEADTARLAALQVHTLLDEPVGAPPAEGEADERPTLADVVFRGPAMWEGPGGQRMLSVFGVRFEALEPTTDDPRIHDLARRSLMRGIRERAAAERAGDPLDPRAGLELTIDGDDAPSRTGQERGANFLIRLDGPNLSIEYTHPSGARETATRDDFRPPNRSSLLPPLLAIALAIALRRPVLALFAGVWCAAALIRIGDGASLPMAVVGGLPDVVTRMWWPQLASPDKQLIIGFVIAMLAMVGVMTISGGIRGMVDSVSKLARGVRSTQIATWLMGIAVFFDDYANCILVGTTMRPLSDRFRISREKLSYIVDSTAAPVAGISIFSTWIAYEVSTFAPQLPAAGLSVDDGYKIFVETLPYRFYCIFTIFFVGAVVVLGRDFGPMLKAERRARATGQVVREGGKPLVGDEATSLEPAPGVAPRARNAVLPVLTFVFVTLFEIVRVGLAAHPELTLGSLLREVSAITDILSDGQSTRAIFVGSTTGLIVATVLALAAGVGARIVRAVFVTLRNMGVAIAILYLAWMIGASCDSLGTASFLSELLGDKLAPAMLPTALFLLSAVIAFATGTSWGTMSILLPLVVSLSYNLGALIPIGGHALMVLSIASVLEGSIFGDHCSPISDTTILSSTASAADHIDHTRTQMAYALVTMATAIVLGYFPAAFMGWSPWISLPAGCAALLMILLVFGRKTDPARA
jgi:Na+/H+ antiporter NhaC